MTTMHDGTQSMLAHDGYPLPSVTPVSLLDVAGLWLALRVGRRQIRALGSHSSHKQVAQWTLLAEVGRENVGLLHLGGGLGEQKLLGSIFSTTNKLCSYGRAGLPLREAKRFAGSG